MKRTVGLIVSGCAALATASAMIAAAGQDRPGEPTQARIWIQSRGIGEAVPVSVEDIGTKRRCR